MSKTNNNSTSGLSKFELLVNKGILSFSILQYPLPDSIANQHIQSTNTTGTKPTKSTGTSTKKPGKNKEKKRISSVFLVLFGLAFSLATISIVGLVGILLAYIFKKNTSESFQDD